MVGTEAGAKTGCGQENNIFIGACAGCNVAADNAIVIGAGAACGSSSSHTSIGRRTASNSIVIGRSAGSGHTLESKIARLRSSHLVG